MREAPHLCVFSLPDGGMAQRFSMAESSSSKAFPRACRHMAGPSAPAFE